MTEHLLKQFAYINTVSTHAFEDNREVVTKVMLDHATRDLSRQHLTIKSYAWQDQVVTYVSEDGTVFDAVEVALVGLAYRLDESSDQTLRKMAIDEARRG